MIRRTVVAAMLFVSLTAVAAPVTKDHNRRAAESLAVLTEEMFFDAKRAAEIAAELRRRATAGVFDNEATGEALAAKLTKEIQDIENDGHLRVKYKPETADQPLLTTAQLQAAATERASGRPVMRMAPGPGDGTGAARPAPRAVGGGTAEESTRKNFEISEARHFEGNVGYVRMDLFESASLAGETFSAAMAFLQNVDAMILDLRKNRGGAQPMVDYVASYFLPTDGRTLLTSRFRGMEPLLARTFEVPGKRMESVPLYILISAKTFSAGEALPYILQKFGRATIVGEKTTGGGRHNALTNMGAGLEASISVSDVVHPVTKSSWQGTGVIPDIATPADQALEAALTHARNAKR